jgi:hypothetical protein
MRRNQALWAATLLLAGGMAVAWSVRSFSTPPDRDLVARQVPAADASPSLPLSQVVLFSSGVGYFQREGEVEGNARVDLQFPVGDVNDLLKSLVLQDLGNGKIGPIAYDGQEPVDKSLRSFSLDLTGNPTFGQILNQARGEKVEITMQQTATSQPSSLAGVIMGIESQIQPNGPAAAIEVRSLNLLCAEGMRSVNLREVQRVRFLNPRLEGELRKALEVLATSRDELKKEVSLNFKGEGKRKVRVGYVVENPIWKTSYRLSVDSVPGADKAKSKVQLQGWAAVENVTDEDWNDVRVVLLSGRPISFEMDMYPPLFVPRPTVEPETYASLRPPSYDGALNRSKIEEMRAANGNPGAGNPGNESPLNAFGNSGALGGMTGNVGFQGAGGLGGGGLGAFGVGGFGGALGIGGIGGLPSGVGGGGALGGQLGFGGQMNRGFNRSQRGGNLAPMPGGVSDASEETKDDTPRNGGRNRLTYEQFQARRRQQGQAIRDEAKAAGEKTTSIDPHGKLASEASSSDLGGHVRYVIEDRISLPRQKSALLPLLDKQIEATRVCIFSESTQGGVIGRLNSPMQPSVDGPTELPSSTWMERFSNCLKGSGCFLYANQESLKSDPPVPLFSDDSPRIKIQAMPGASLANVMTEVLGQQGLTYLMKDDRIEILKKVHANSFDRPLRPSEVVGIGVGVSSSPGSEANYPLLGLRVKNTTGQPLTPGPVTVYEDGVYAGDASLPTLQPSEERLVAYAIDLATEVKTEVRQSSGPAMTLSLVGEQLIVRHTVRETRKYIARNRSTHDRQLIIEHPIRVGWDLAKGVKPTERTRDAYRFEVKLPAGKDIEFEVAEEQESGDNFSARHDKLQDGVRTLHFVTGLDLEVIASARMLPVELEKVRVIKGDIEITNRQRVEQSYQVFNTSGKDGRVITVRHRVGPDWRIVDDSAKGKMQTKNFTLKLAPGKDGRADAANERDLSNTWTGTMTPAAQIEKLLAHQSLSANVRAALKKVHDQRADLEQQRSQVVELQKRLKEIGEEQERLRKNIANLPQTSAAYKRYLEKFDKQETEIESLQDQVKKLKESEKYREKELADLLEGLNVE